MQVRIKKWGDSLAFRIPKSFAAQMSLKEDSLVNWSLSDGRLIVEAVNPKYDPDELPDQMTEETPHR